MTDTGPGGEDVFDLERIRQLVELMKEHDLAQVDLQQGEQRIQLQRAVGARELDVVQDSPSVASNPGVASGATSIGGVETVNEAGNIVYIKSPMVGTFYLRPNPESELFAKVGDLVSPDTTVCIVEAMKVFNEIPADVSGRIVAILAENEEPVEFGKPLFKVDTNG